MSSVKSQQYHAHKMGSILNLVIGMAKANPQLLDNRDLFIANLKTAMPELARKDYCPACAASMAEYTYSFDAWDAILLLRMGEVVRRRMADGMDFTVANQVRVPELEVTHAVRCRTTHASKLGLVAKLRNKENKQVAGVWVITNRGWNALAGNPVPAKVKVFRGRIEERFEEKTTITAALKSHVDYVEKEFFKGRTPKQDYRQEVSEYDPRKWVEFSTHASGI